MLTKKHFEAIAKILHEGKEETTSWYGLRNSFTTWLAEQNPNFDKERFEDATENGMKRWLK